MKKQVAAACIVAAYWIGHFAYHQAPLAIEGDAYTICGALSRAILLAVAVAMYRSPLVDVPASGMLVEEMQVIGCGLSYIKAPWPVLPGQSKCSEALGLPLGTMGAVLLIWICLWLLDKFREK